MEEMIVEISQLFDFIETKYNIKFQLDELQEIPFVIEMKNENDEWVRASKLIKKEAEIWKTRFSNGIILESADNHLISLDPIKEISIFTKDLKAGDKIDYLNTRVVDNIKIKNQDYVFGCQIESPKHLYKTPDGLIHHNTYEIMETCKANISKSPTKAKYVYEAGDIGSSMSSLVPFFYKHSQNKIIVLDDNDKMITNGLSQDIMNIMKAILDPKADDEKPITVRANMLDIFSKRLADLEEEPIKESGHWIEIDKEALREGQCVIAVNDNIVVNHPIKLQEAQELSNMIFEPKKSLRETKYIDAQSTDDLRRMSEATNKEFLSDLIGSDDDEEDEYSGMTKKDIEELKASKAAAASMKKSGATEQGEEGKSFPRRFLFNSSVIFISNLTSEDVNVAVLDRCENVEIKLTLDQFLQRLGRIYGNLCKGTKYSNIPQEYRDWAKKCVYTALGMVIEAWKHRVVLWKTPVEINRKFTFRMFDEFVVAWIRFALDRAERVDGRDLDDKAYRDKLSKELIPEIIRRKIIPFVKQRTKS